MPKNQQKLETGIKDDESHGSQNLSRIPNYVFAESEISD